MPTTSPSSAGPSKNKSPEKQILKRNLVHRSSVSGADSGSAVFQAHCLSRNTSIFTWISGEIPSSLVRWEAALGVGHGVGGGGVGAGPRGRAGPRSGSRTLRLGKREAVPSPGPSEPSSSHPPASCSGPSRDTAQPPSLHHGLCPPAPSPPSQSPGHLHDPLNPEVC